jgi:hypothetical protein
MVRCTFNVRCTWPLIRSDTSRCHRERTLRSDLNWHCLGWVIAMGQPAACELGLLQSLRSFAMTHGEAFDGALYV